MHGQLYPGVFPLALAMVVAWSGGAFAQSAVDSKDESAPTAKQPDEAAQPDKAEQPDEADKPWAKGVSSEEKAAALELFQRGNHFFERSQYQKALIDYRKAVARWDHPAIRYNMAVCLINLDEPLEAHENLEKGLAYGESPFDSRLYAEGQTYMKLLQGRLTRLTVAVKEAGARVYLDGEDLFVAPGAATRLVLPGKHQIVARKENMLTETKALLLEGGKESMVEIKMRPLSEGVVMKRRWAAWKPWAVAGGSAGLALLGGLSYALSDSNITRYDSYVEANCPTGCDYPDLPGGVRKRDRRGTLYSHIAVTLLVTAGAGVVTSGVLLILNRKRPVTLETRSRPAPPIAVAPFLGRGTVGLSTALRF